MNKTITITSKGQTTIPVAMRRKLGLNKSGGKLEVSFNEIDNQLIIKKQAQIEDLSKRLSSYIKSGTKSGTKPVTNADNYYQENREIKK